MSTVGELLVRIVGNNAQLKAAFAESNAASAAFAGKMEASSATSSAALRGVGIASAAVAVGVVAFGAEAVRQASSFQSSMELIRTQAGATQDEVTAMSASILQLAPTVGTGPEALATALYHIESAGLRGAKALDILKIAAEGAKVGHANLESVTNALVASVNSGIKGTTNMGEAMGVLNAIVGSGNMRMQDLTDAMSSGILSAARAFGLSIQDVGGAIADMTNQGVPAIDAATRLRMTISLLGAPSTKAATELRSIGITSRQLADDMRNKGLLSALEDLSTHLLQSGLDATQQAELLSKAFGGGKSSSAILTLLGSLDHLGVIQKQITAGTSDFGAAWTATEQTTTAEGEKVQASLQDITTAIGTGLLPMVGSLLSQVVPVVSVMAQWTAANPALAATILAVVGGVAALGAAVAFLGPILGGIGAVIGVITSPLVLLAATAAGLAAHFGLLGASAKSAFDGLAATASSAVAKVIAMLPKPVQEAISAVTSAIQVIVDAIGGFVTDAGNQAVALTAIGTAGDFARAALGWLGDTIRGIVGTIGDFVGNANNQASALGVVGTAADIVSTALGALGTALGVVVGWVSTFIDHLTGTREPASKVSSLLGTVVVILGRIVEIGATVVSTIADISSTIIDAIVHSEAFKDALKVLGVAGDAINVAFGLIGDALGTLIDLIGKVVALVQEKLAVAFDILKVAASAVVVAFNLIGTAVGFVIDKLTALVNLIAEHAGELKLLSLLAGAGGGSAGFNLGQDLGKNLFPTKPPTPAAPAAPTTDNGLFGTGLLKGVKFFQSGGIVPGIGPQLIVAHGGERITPAGRPGGFGGGGSSTSAIEFHSHIYLDNQQIAEHVDRGLYTSLGIYNQAPPATGSAR